MQSGSARVRMVREVLGRQVKRRIGGGRLEFGCLTIGHGVDGTITGRSSRSAADPTKSRWATMLLSNEGSGVKKINTTS